MEKVRETGEYFREKLQGLVQTLPDKVEGVRGLGLMQGVVLKAPCAALVGELLQKGFVVNCTQERVLRFVPPLIVQKEDIDALASALVEAIAAWQPK